MRFCKAHSRVRTYLVFSLAFEPIFRDFSIDRFFVNRSSINKQKHIYKVIRSFIYENGTSMPFSGARRAKKDHKSLKFRIFENED